MSLEGSEWFFCIVYTSLTGSLAYGLWKDWSMHSLMCRMVLL